MTYSGPVSPNDYMNRANTSRFVRGRNRDARLAGLVLFGAAWAGSLSAQTPQSSPAKPSAAVSTLPAAPTTAAPASSEGVPAAPVAAHKVDVEFTDGKLAVQATNASLNEILREVSHKTGMTITGGVVDDRVFGSYGPSTPAVVLDALLQGTGSNILLVDDAKGGSQLILTPRRGGATPPSPNAAAQSDGSDESTPTMYIAPERPFQPPIANGRGPTEARPDPETPEPEGDPGDGTVPKTPQQIYEQLQQSMQKQQNNAPTPPPDQE